MQYYLPVNILRVFLATAFLVLSGADYSEAQKKIIESRGKEEIRFKYILTKSIKPHPANLGRNKILTLSFPAIEGVTKVKIIIDAKAGGIEKTVERSAAMRPARGQREVRFDFTSDPAWNGIGGEITLELSGTDAGVVMPEISVEPPTVSKRLSIFLETWMRPVELHGLVVNVLYWPDFLGIPAAVAVGSVWLLGGLGIVVFKRFKARQAAKAVFVWSLLIWVALDGTLLLSRALSLPRLMEMKGRLSDTVGIWPGQIDGIRGLLKRHGVSRLGAVGGNHEDVYFRFALLPARVNENFENEHTLLAIMNPDMKIKDAGLLFNGGVILRNVEILDSVGSAFLVRGD